MADPRRKRADDEDEEKEREEQRGAPPPFSGAGRSRAVDTMGAFERALSQRFKQPAMPTAPGPPTPWRPPEGMSGGYIDQSQAYGFPTGLGQIFQPNAVPVTGIPFWNPQTGEGDPSFATGGGAYDPVTGQWKSADTGAATPLPVTTGITSEMAGLPPHVLAALAADPKFTAAANAFTGQFAGQGGLNPDFFSQGVGFTPTGGGGLTAAPQLATTMDTVDPQQYGYFYKDKAALPSFIKAQGPEAITKALGMQGNVAQAKAPQGGFLGGFGSILPILSMLASVFPPTMPLGLGLGLLSAANQFSQGNNLMGGLGIAGSLGGTMFNQLGGFEGLLGALGGGAGAGAEAGAGAFNLAGTGPGMFTPSFNLGGGIGGLTPSVGGLGASLGGLGGGGLGISPDIAALFQGGGGGGFNLGGLPNQIGTTFGAPSTLFPEGAPQLAMGAGGGGGGGFMELLKKFGPKLLKEGAGAMMPGGEQQPGTMQQQGGDMQDVLGAMGYAGSAGQGVQPEAGALGAGRAAGAAGPTDLIGPERPEDMERRLRQGAFARLAGGGAPGGLPEFGAMRG